MMPAQEAPLNYARPLKKQGIFIVIGIMLFLVAAGTISIFVAFCPDTSIGARSLLLLLAAFSLALPVWIAFTVCRRKLKTGRFLLTAEERLAFQQKSVTRQASPLFRKFFRIFNSIMIPFWIGISIFWIRSAIHKSTGHAWAWAAYWIILSIINIVLMVRSIKRPPFGINPTSGSPSIPEETQFDASNKPESSIP